MSPAYSENRFSSVVESVLRGNSDERTKALEHIIAAHWKPLYKYLRAQYGISHTEAGTMTLNFLAQVQEKNFFAQFDGRKAPVREYLREELDVFVPTPGAKKSIPPSPSFDFDSAGEEFQSDQVEPSQSAQEYYKNEWVRNLLTLAVEELNTILSAEGRSLDFSLFMKLDLQDRSGAERVTLEDIATELSMPLGDALVSLAKTRQRFQTILLDLIRSFTSSEAEFRREAQTFFRS